MWRVVFSSLISLIWGSRALKKELGTAVNCVLAGKPVNCFIVGSVLRKCFITSLVLHKYFIVGSVLH